MATTCSHHHPRAAAPVRSAEAALKAITLAGGVGEDPCVVLACLDRDRRPLTMFVVEDGHGPDDLRRAVDVLLDAGAHTALAAVVVALSRPGEDAAPSTSDLATWRTVQRSCTDVGVLPIDWFILADGQAVSVTEYLGDTAPW